MTRRALALALVLGLGAAPIAPRPIAAADPAEVHGADTVFAGRGVVVVWSVLRRADEGATLVVLRVAARNPAIDAVAVDLVDPFSRQRVVAVAPAPIGRGREIRIRRARFADHPRLELRFAAAVGLLLSGTAAFTVYFTGVPDTTPEFAGEEALAAYLETALARATPR